MPSVARAAFCNRRSRTLLTRARASRNSIQRSVLHAGTRCLSVAGCARRACRSPAVARCQGCVLPNHRERRHRLLVPFFVGAWATPRLGEGSAGRSRGLSRCARVPGGVGLPGDGAPARRDSSRGARTPGGRGDDLARARWRVVARTPDRARCDGRRVLARDGRHVVPGHACAARDPVRRVRAPGFEITSTHPGGSPRGSVCRRYAGTYDIETFRPNARAPSDADRGGPTQVFPIGDLDGDGFADARLFMAYYLSESRESYGQGWLIKYGGPLASDIR